MAKQVAEVGGYVEHISGETDPTHLFNIRFRPRDAQLYDPLVRAAKTDAVWRRHRYTLAAATEQVTKDWYARKGTTTPPLIRSITRNGTPTVVYDPLHQRLQAGLLPLLQGRYGTSKVRLEVDYVDITIADGSKTILIEIKSYANPRAAIREALGQLLEYAYYRKRPQGQALELVIVAPGPLDNSAEEYLCLLRTQFKIPISYCEYAEGSPLPRLFGQSR